MDSKLIFQEIQNKNHFVFKNLFETKYQDLVIYANTYLYDKDSSEDVVQEVFVYLWSQSSSIEIKTNLDAYLYTMVRNKCLNTLKAIKITYTPKISKLQSHLENSFIPDSVEENENIERLEKAVKIMENLPLRMRNIVKLRFIENYKYNEIADELGVSINTVKTQLKRAKIKLAQLIVSLITLFWLF